MTYSCKDLESGLEVVLHLDVIEHKFKYFFRSTDGEETDPITVSETQFLQQNNTPKLWTEGSSFRNEPVERRGQ